MAKRNIWVLPMNHTYKILGLSYRGAEEVCDVCQNCWRMIQNIAVIQNEEWIKFTVGLDCANTLESQEISNYWEFEQNKKELRNFTSRLSAIRKLIKDNKVSKVLRMKSKDWLTTTYKVYYWICNSIGTYNVYKQWRGQFGEWIEKTFRSIIQDFTFKY